MRAPPDLIWWGDVLGIDQGGIEQWFPLCYVVILALLAVGTAAMWIDRGD